jgi:hypothetical protein
MNTRLKISQPSGLKLFIDENFKISSELFSPNIDYSPAVGIPRQVYIGLFSSNLIDCKYVELSGLYPVQLHVENYSPINSLSVNALNLQDLAIITGVPINVVQCRNNLLTELRLPKGIEEVRCGGNSIKFNRLYTSDSIKSISCDHGVIDSRDFMHLDTNIFIE